MKKKVLVTVLAAVLFSVGCSKDESEGRITLKLSAVNAGSIQTAKSAKALVEFTDLQISIRDVVFKNDDDSSSSLDSTDVLFRGPYTVDLLNGSDALSQTIGTAPVPDGLYQELRFKLHKDEDRPANDPLFDRSVYLEGTVDGTPFIFWHDTSENLDVGRSTGVLVTDNVATFTVTFDISQFLSSFHQIDIASAQDGNGNGIIEINPNDMDGNRDMADMLKENIKATADLIDR